MKNIIPALSFCLLTFICRGQVEKSLLFGTWELVENKQKIILQFEQNGILDFMQNGEKFKSEYKFISDSTIFLGTTLYRISALKPKELILETVDYWPNMFRYRKIDFRLESINESEKVEEFYLNGNKRLEGQRINGLMDGKWTEWYENGKVKEIHYFVKAYPVGIHQVWFENGNLKEEKKFNEHHEVIYLKRWTETGKLVLEK